MLIPFQLSGRGQPDARALRIMQLRIGPVSPFARPSAWTALSKSALSATGKDRPGPQNTLAGALSRSFGVLVPHLLMQCLSFTFFVDDCGGNGQVESDFESAPPFFP